jgi:hypothetical protein
MPIPDFDGLTFVAFTDMRCEEGLGVRVRDIHDGASPCGFGRRWRRSCGMRLATAGRLKKRESVERHNWLSSHRQLLERQLHVSEQFGNAEAETFGNAVNPGQTRFLFPILQFAQIAHVHADSIGEFFLGPLPLAA